MTFVITQPCCNDAACVPTCPVNAIHPAPGEPGYMTTEMLYIDPESCIDCQACVQVCPVNAIVAEEELTADNKVFLDINASFFQQHPTNELEPPPASTRHREARGLRVAIVGSGPAGSYAAAELLSQRGVEVDVYERLLTPYGLVRSGVAPDHGGTKAVTDGFPYKRPPATFRTFFGIEVGRDVMHDELADAYHAVLYASGANGDRSLGIPGEDKIGCHSAREFVAWYNGHPDHADHVFDLSAERVVVVGNGNVALDVARILCTDPEVLAKTDIAEHALEALRGSAVREVVVVGRRGPEQAAYTSAEIVGLMSRGDLDVRADAGDVERAARAMDRLRGSESADSMARWKEQFAVQMASGETASTGRRITFRYLTSPVEILGTRKVTGVRVAVNDLVEADGRLSATPTDTTEEIHAGLVLRSVGYYGAPVDGLPFDEALGIVPNSEGRVLGADGTPQPKAYVAGWIKRGPSGVIGTNRQCAAETVSAIISDFADGLLEDPATDKAQFDNLLGSRKQPLLALGNWANIDAAEVAAGRSQGKPRVKFVRESELLGVAEGNVGVTA